MKRLPTVCILAGGLGARLGERVQAQPKPLLEVAGRPFLWHQLRLLAAHGASDVVLCVGYLGELVRERIGSELFGLRIAYSFDAPELEGTLGAIRRARGMLGQRFLVLYGDTYLRIDYAAAAAAWQTSGLPAMMCVLRNDGRWESSNADYADGRVLAYEKSAPSAHMRWIDYGLGGLEQRALECAPAEASDLCDLYRVLAEKRQLFGFLASERFYEIGTPATLAETDAFLRASGHVVAAAEPEDPRALAATAGVVGSASQGAGYARAGVVGQGARYGLAGATVTLVYLLTTSALAGLAHLRFQAALAIGFCTALSVHFTLQRRFVWAGRGEFALALPRQALRYLATAATQYGATAAGTALLPSLLGVPVEGVYLVLAVVLATINFVVFRQLVFHPLGARAIRSERLRHGREEHAVDPPERRQVGLVAEPLPKALLAPGVPLRADHTAADAGGRLVE